jgi:hypothetical protein
VGQKGGLLKKVPATVHAELDVDVPPDEIYDFYL